VDGDGCDRNCTPSACGNGVQAPGELCDDGNTVNGDGCDQGCTPSACGNGVQAPLELCDDGNTVDGDGCDQNCTPTGCGNGIITAGEMCDDGNTLDGDLCSHTCRDAQCGNGDVDQGEECDDGNEEDGDECDTNCTKPVCGNRVVVPPEVCDDGNTVDGDGCDANCTPTGCGNHVVTYGEGCDDGDNESGDGCSRTCLTEHPEQEPNDSAAAANGDFLAPCAVLQDPSSAADVDWFVIRLDRRADLRLETSDGQGLGSCAGGLDTVLRLYLPDGTTSVASDDDGGVDRCSLIDPQRAAGARALAPGNYFAYVYRTANAPASILHATLQECGDGRLEQSEVCDDGNATAGDGCTAACLVETGWQCGTTAPTACWPTCGDRRVLGPEECDDGNVVAGDGCSPQCRNDPGHFFERESNNTRETANGPLQPDVVVHGAISPVGDQDVVTVELAGATDLWLETTDLRGLGYCQTIRTRVELRGPTGASLVQVTTGGTGGCSRVDPATHPAVRRLAAGSYTVHVSDDNNTEAIPGYLLHVTGQLCGDGVLQGREACDDGGRQDGDGCSELCTVEVGWTCAPPGTCTPTCGDARLVGAETCEDGNTVAGDGCSQVCQNEPGHFFEVEPNNASLDARDTSAPVILHGAILPATDVDWYQVQLAAPWDVRVVLTGAGGPGTCTGTPLVRLHAEQGTVLAQAAGTTGVCPRIEPTTTPLVRGLAPGNYRVSVEENGRNAQIAAYQAHVTLQRCGDRAVTGSETCDDGNTGGGDGCSAGCLAEPGWACQGEPSACAVVCGDGIRLPQEVCDDGNTVGADGCSPVCLAEPGHVFEAEPNTRDQPNGPYPFPVVFHGAITPVGDVDHVVVETTAPGSLKVETVQSSATSLCPSIDTVVAVYDATGLNRLAMDDSSGEGSCSLLDPATTAGVALRNLAAGRYIVAVWDRGSDHAIPGYVLVVSFTRAP
jgi:cysteine-rich repeat protein